VNHLKRHLSVANVLSCMALFVALSGATYAATTASKNSVKAKSIAKGAVTTPKLRNGAVTTPKIRNGAVIGTKIAPGAVGSSQLLDGGVRSVDLGGSVVTTAKLKDSAVTGAKLANNAVAASKLAADAVTTGKLQEGAVTSVKLAPTFLAQLVRNVSYVPAESASNNTEATKTATATCPTGKQVIGGGAKVVGGTILVAITESAPAPANAEGKRTGWIAVAKEEGGGGATNWSVEAHAICAEF
jgi:trimeric autotransporter adhesin